MSRLAAARLKLGALQAPSPRTDDQASAVVGVAAIWAEWVVAASEEAATSAAAMSWAVAEVAPSAAVR